MSDDERKREPEWDVDWEAARVRQLTKGLDVTPAERLAWLEEMIGIAFASGAPKRSSPI